MLMLAGGGGGATLQWRETWWSLDYLFMAGSFPKIGRVVWILHPWWGAASTFDTVGVRDFCRCCVQYERIERREVEGVFFPKLWKLERRKKERSHRETRGQCCALVAISVNYMTVPLSSGELLPLLPFKRERTILENGRPLLIYKSCH